MRNNSPFYSLTQYNRDYLPFGGSASIPMKPFDQIANPNQSDLPHMMDTTYRTDYKKFGNKGDSHHDNGRYKMHINPGQPNLYMNTTYQNAYIKKQGIKTSRFRNRDSSNEVQCWSLEHAIRLRRWIQLQDCVPWTLCAYGIKKMPSSSSPWTNLWSYLNPWNGLHCSSSKSNIGSTLTNS